MRISDWSSDVCSSDLVALFPLLFREQADEWPEQDERETCWFDLADAAEAVDEPELKALIAGFREPPAPTPLSEWAMPAVQSKRSEEHTSELQSLMRISYAVFCLKKKKKLKTHKHNT